MSTRNGIDRRIPCKAPFALIRAFAVVCVTLSACAHDAPLQPGGGRAGPRRPAAELNPACDDALGGQTHNESTIDTPATWSRANNPHRVPAPLIVDSGGSVTIEPGVVICFDYGTYMWMLNGSRLVANGLDTALIVFTTHDLSDVWFGLSFTGGTGSADSLKNVRMERIHFFAYAVAAYGDNAMTIDSSVFRYAGGGLYLVGRGSSISRSRVDTTSARNAAVTLGTLGRFEETVIRGAPGIGLRVEGTHGVSLLGGRIEGSGGVGLQVTTPGAGFVATRPVRVVGGASYPAEMVVSALPRIYPAVADQDSLLGNARDTLVVTGGILQAFAYPKPALPWHVTGNITVQYFGILAPRPGAALVLDPGVSITAVNGGRLVARGTPAAPVRFSAADIFQAWGGILLQGSPSLDSYLTNVRIENASTVNAADSHTLAIDSAVLHNVRSVFLGSANSRISRSRVDHTPSAGPFTGTPVVGLASNAKIENTAIYDHRQPGLGVYSTAAQVLSCDIRRNWGAGIELHAAAKVHDCNLVDNGGPGILNLDSFAANVENNWWGDTAGPTGASGDGVSGPLDYTPWRLTPYVLPYVP